MLTTSRQFYIALVAITLLKLALAAWLPLTGDEAYFYIWAKYPGWGYYDHPPMVGWWLQLLLYFGQAEWWLRLPAVVLTSFIAWCIYRVLRGNMGLERARLVAGLYLLAPVSVIAVLISTDTPLVLFSFLSVLALKHALNGANYRWFVLSGVLLGLAFLSKYFAVLLGFAYGVYLLLIRPGRRNTIGLLLLFVAVLPFAGFNAWWNYQHCWDNVLFNLVNRHSGEEVSWREPLTYFVMMVYLITPPLLWFGWQQRGAWLQALRVRELYPWLWVLPLLLFAVLSFSARIGLHWVLAFYPLLFLALPQTMGLGPLRRSVIFMAGFSALHVIGLVIALLLPMDAWKSQPNLHQAIAYGRYTSEFWQSIEPHTEGRVLATDSYVNSAILEYATGKRVRVFGLGSKHGRQDDINTDWRELDGKNMALLLYSERAVASYGRFFDHHSVLPVTVRGSTDYLILGQGFRYQVYRDQVLRRSQQQFYRLPWYLPCGSCYFYDKYFSDEDIARLPRP